MNCYAARGAKTYQKYESRSDYRKSDICSCVSRLVYSQSVQKKHRMGVALLKKESSHSTILSVAFV